MYKYATGLPAHAAVIGLVNPLTVTIVRKGMAGYFTIMTADNESMAHAIRDTINIALGVTPPQREAMYAGSLFGFDCPGADPATYDADGNIGKPQTTYPTDEPINATGRSVDHQIAHDEGFDVFDDMTDDEH